MSPPCSPLPAFPVSLQNLYDKQRLLVQCYKEESRFLLNKLVIDSSLEYVKTLILMDPTLYKTFDLITEIEHDIKKREEDAKKRKQLVLISGSSNSLGCSIQGLKVVLGFGRFQHMRVWGFNYYMVFWVDFGLRVKSLAIIFFFWGVKFLTLMFMGFC